MAIHLKKPEEELYNILQQKSLECVQELSHTIWTDFNEHDPGVTILDLLNYVLWELDYQLSFDLEDYLNTKEGGFDPQTHGLFSPRQVFPVSPVTSNDYRKLFFDLADDIEDVQITRHIPDPRSEYDCCGLYDVKIQLNIWSDNSIRRNYIRERIKECYAANRNLCESLNEIIFANWHELQIKAEIQIESDQDASVLLATIYKKAWEVLAEGMHYRQFSKQENPEEVFDGPSLTYYIIDDRSLKKERSVSFLPRLYKKIQELPGVKAIYTLDLQPADALVETYVNIRFPKKREEIEIVLIKEDKEISVNFEVVSRLLRQYRVSSKGNQYRLSDLSPYYPPPASKYRDIYKHYSVQHDFPNCYGINEWGIAPYESDQRKAQAHQLKAYLLLFDLIFAKGLKELEEFPAWMALNDFFPADENPDLSADTFLQWNELVDADRRKANEKDRIHTLREEKSKWLDVLDRLYGEDSNPSFLAHFNYYEDTDEYTMERRIRFLKEIPSWGKDRFKGINVNKVSSEGMSGIEKYIHSLLGFEGIPMHPVSNLYASYNLEVLNDTTFFNKLGWLMDYRLIVSESNKFVENQLKEINIGTIPWSDSYYTVLRQQIPFLRQGVIFESLLRGGLKKENFRQLSVSSFSPVLFHQLLFYYEKKQEWISLGRFESEEALTNIATVLHSFLRMLNKKSETFYVVEHLLLCPVPLSPEKKEEAYGSLEITDCEEENESESDRLPLDFSLSVVFAGGSVRMSDPLFRKEVEIVVRDRLPVHLDAYIMWLKPEETVVFERLYYAWREALASSIRTRINETSGKLAAFLVEIKNKREDDYDQ